MQRNSNTHAYSFSNPNRDRYCDGYCNVHGDSNSNGKRNSNPYSEPHTEIDCDTKASANSRTAAVEVPNRGVI